MTLLLLFGGGVPVEPPTDVGVTVEIAFGYTWEDADPVWVDVTDYVDDDLSVTRGRSRELDTFQTGAARFTLVNDDRRFDPWNEDGPYYGQILPNVPVRIRATWADTYDVFRGFVDGWPQTYTPADVQAHVPIRCSDAFKLLSQFGLSAGVFTFDDPVLGFDRGRFGGEGIDESQLSGARIGSLLDLCGWPAALRDIDDGVTVCQAQEADDSALDAMQTVEQSEDGFLFVGADGSVTFVDRYGRITRERMTDSQATFSDQDDSTYDDITYPFDDQLIYNDVRRTRAGGSERSVDDATSVGRYFRRVHSLTGLVMDSDTVAEGLARLFLERYREPQRRVDGLVIDPDNDPLVQWPLVLGLRILDRVTVSRTPQQVGDPIVGDYWIQGMTHTYRGLRWRSNFYVTPVDDFEFFTFDDADLGFDSDAVFAP